MKCPICQFGDHSKSDFICNQADDHYYYRRADGSDVLDYKGMTVNRGAAWPPAYAGMYAHIRYPGKDYLIKEYWDYLPSWEELIEQVKLLSLFS